MTGFSANDGGRRGNHWRIAGWSTAALLLLLPWIAMRFTDEVAWDATDFLVFGALLLVTGLIFEMAVKKTGNPAYRLAAGMALSGAFLLVWINGAVGMIGAEDNDANVLYGGVLAVGILGAVIARFRPRGMAHTLLATALAQALVAVIAIAYGWGGPAHGALEISLLNGFFVALFAASALLFRSAAQA